MNHIETATVAQTCLYLPYQENKADLCQWDGRHAWS